MFTVRSEAGAAVIAVDGRLDGTSTPDLEPVVTDALAMGQGVVLDCSGLSYIASVGLRLVLLAARRAAQSGQKLAVCALQPQVLEVFEISGLDTLITICRAKADALVLVAAAV